MKKLRTLSLAIALFSSATLLTSCLNMYGFIDKPSGDDQLLSAARSCLDRGDFECARRYYTQVSAAMSDEKVSELVLTTLAENNIFSISDLITSLGSNRGGAGTFALLAQTAAAKSKIMAADRTIIQAGFADATAIVEPHLKSFIKFISALSMLSNVLGNAVGADGLLTKSDLVNNAVTCAAGVCDVASCDGPTTIAAYAGTGVVMTSSSLWTAAANLDMLVQAISQANSNASTILSGSSGSGIFAGAATLDAAIAVITGSGFTNQKKDRCIRQALLGILF